MKKRVLSLALCLVLVVGLFSGLTVNASASRLDDLKKEIAEKLIKEKIEQFKEEFEIPDLDTDAILSSFATAATEGDFGVNNCLHWEVSTGVLSGKTLTISGTGAMPDFDFPNGNLAPWWNYEALGMLTSFGNFKLEGELKKVVIKDGVTNVSDYALFFLPAATQVTLPESVTRIGRYGIAMCSKLTGMSIPKGVAGIGDFGLAGNGLTAITLPDGLQSLGRGAFDSCASLTNTTLPAAITAVPGKCFADCTKLLNVKYAGTVTAIGDLAFESCKALTAAPIPETVTAIDKAAFTGCTALTDVTIPAGVSTIPEDCFRGCTALADIDLPGTVTHVGHNAFTGCTALKDVRCYGAPPARGTTTPSPGRTATTSLPARARLRSRPTPPSRASSWSRSCTGTRSSTRRNSPGTPRRSAPSPMPAVWPTGPTPRCPGPSATASSRAMRTTTARTTSTRMAAPRARRRPPSSCATASSSAREPALPPHSTPPRERTLPGLFARGAGWCGGRAARCRMVRCGQRGQTARAERAVRDGADWQKCAAAADRCARPAEPPRRAGKGHGKRWLVYITSLIAPHLC